MEMLKPQDAARLIGVSYPTLKTWIYKGTVQSVLTPGGHHRIPQSEVDRLTHSKKTSTKPRGRQSPLSAISGRNKLLGAVTEVKFEGLLAQVTISLGDQSITSIITRDACEELGLKKGAQAYALIKATEVMIVRA